MQLFLGDFNICSRWKISYIAILELWTQGSVVAFLLLLLITLPVTEITLYEYVIKKLCEFELGHRNCLRNQWEDIYILLPDMAFTIQTWMLFLNKVTLLLRQYFHIFSCSNFCLDWHGVWTIYTHLVHMWSTILLVIRKHRFQCSCPELSFMCWKICFNFLSLGVSLCKMVINKVTCCLSDNPTSDKGRWKNRSYK